MTAEPPKSSEIKRLTTPLTFKEFKAYDSTGKPVKCSETLSDVRLVVEPQEGILTDDEILQYAPLSKAASKVRLKRGFGDNQDILYINESRPWIIGLYYVILFCIAIPIVQARNTTAMVILLILTVIPLIYLYRMFKLDSYRQTEVTAKKKVHHKSESKSESKSENESEVKYEGIESLKSYKNEIDNLVVLFDVKQNVVREMVEKRFEPPQITYDKFIGVVDNSQKMFNSLVESATNIINLAAEDTPRVRNEIQNKINAMKTIINQMEDLTNELVINISSEDTSSQEVKNLLDDMENLIDSVKDY